MFERQHTKSIRVSVWLVIAAALAFQVSVAQATLIHDYNFAVSGTTADSVGGATYNGTLNGTATVTAGQGLVLDGDASGYLSLPTGANSVLPSNPNVTSVTIEAWFKTAGENTSPSWSRLFDLGSYVPSQAIGYNSVDFAPFVNTSPVVAWATLTKQGPWWHTGGTEADVSSELWLTDGNTHHVAVQLNQVGSDIQMQMATDNVVRGTSTLSNQSLSTIAWDTTDGVSLGNYLGKDFWGYGNFAGTISEFKVSATTTPEPGVLVLLISGLPALLAYAWRKRR